MMLNTCRTNCKKIKTKTKQRQFSPAPLAHVKGDSGGFYLASPVCFMSVAPKRNCFMSS